MIRRLWVLLFSLIALIEIVKPAVAKLDDNNIGKSNCVDKEINRVLADLEFTTAANITQAKDRIKKLLQVRCNPCSTDYGVPELEKGYVMVGNGTEIPVFHEQTRFGGGWTVLMQRYDGSVNFNRTWAEYRDGFGVVGHEFWIGLERMHQLTSTSPPYELMIEMEDFDGNYKYAGYDKFAVGPAEQRYPLELGKFNGTTAGDSLTAHKGSGFSTFDNDAYGCSNKYADGGWWYHTGKCYGSSLTGIWKNEYAYSSICWMKYSANPKTPLKFVRMMIRHV